MIKKLLLSAILLLMTGCGGPYLLSVYGGSGAVFTAPSLCAALIQCKNSKETVCYYDSTVVLDATGKVTEASTCKAISK